MRRPARVKEEIPVLAGFSCRLVDDQREPKPPWSSLFFLLRKILTFASLLSKPPSASRPPRQPFGIRVSPSGSALLPCPVRRGRLSPRFHPHSVEPCRLGASWGPSFWWGAAISAAVSDWTYARNAVCPSSTVMPHIGAGLVSVWLPCFSTSRSPPRSCLLLFPVSALPLCRLAIA